MNDSELVRQLDDDITRLRRLRDLLAEPDERDGLTVLARMKDSFNGWPRSSGFDRSAPRSTDSEGEPLPGHGDPTGEAAARPDHARDARLRLERNAQHIHRSVDQLLDDVDRFILRAANPLEQAATADVDDEGCTSCRRIAGPRTAHWWNPVFRRGLCRFCWEYEKATGRLPSKDELADHRDGKKIRRTA